MSLFLDSRLILLLANMSSVPVRCVLCTFCCVSCQLGQYSVFHNRVNSFIKILLQTLFDHEGSLPFRSVPGPHQQSDLGHHSRTGGFVQFQVIKKSPSVPHVLSCLVMSLLPQQRQAYSYSCHLLGAFCEIESVRNVSSQVPFSCIHLDGYRSISLAYCFF